MSIYNKILCALIFTFTTNLLMAQSNGENGSSPNTNSPYSRYGFGLLSDQSFGNSKAMGGIAIGLRDGRHINPANPASYTAIDSLTFLFDAGMSFQNGNFSDGTVSRNAKNTSFDYIAMQFRLHKRLGMTLGFLPFSSVGYNITTTEKITNAGGSSNLSSYSVFSGEGGINQMFIGLGAKPINNLSVGINASFLFGSITQSTQTSFSENTINTTLKEQKVTIRDYKLDFGLQYTQPINKKHQLTFGLIYSLGHKMNTDASTTIQRVNTSTGLVEGGDNTPIKGGFDLPHSFGAGITYQFANHVTAGFDYTHQQWAEASYFGETGKLQNRDKYAIGAEYIPNPLVRNYFKRVHYRIGAYYSTPYVSINGAEAKEYGASVGFGLPIFQSKSLLNISVQYSKVKPNIQAKGLLDENYIRFNIGLTFNERWFAKWRVE